MTVKKTGEAPRTRYMTLEEVARELRVSRGDVRNKVYAGHLVGVDIGNTAQSRFRVTRSSFEAYCDRLEAEAAQRFGVGAA